MASIFTLTIALLFPGPETELLVEETIEFAHRRFASENEFLIADNGHWQWSHRALALLWHCQKPEFMPQTFLLQL